MVSIAEAVDEAIDHARREAKAFLRPFVALQKDVVGRGRDPGVLIFAGKE